MADFEKKVIFFSTKGVVKWKLKGEKKIILVLVRTTSV